MATVSDLFSNAIYWVQFLSAQQTKPPGKGVACKSDSSSQCCSDGASQASEWLRLVLLMAPMFNGLYQLVRGQAPMPLLRARRRPRDPKSSCPFLAVIGRRQPRQGLCLPSLAPPVTRTPTAQIRAVQTTAQKHDGDHCMACRFIATSSTSFGVSSSSPSFRLHHQVTGTLASPTSRRGSVYCSWSNGTASLRPGSFSKSPLNAHCSSTRER